jgi:multidrug efflux pump subunit AcrB
MFSTLLAAESVPAPIASPISVMETSSASEIQRAASTGVVTILSSCVLSVAGVVFDLIVTRITSNVASFMGLIVVIGIVAK